MTLLKEMPLAELSIGKVLTVKIDFTSSGALPYEYLTKKIFPLLERHGYDSSRLEFVGIPSGTDADNPVETYGRNFKKTPNEKYMNRLTCEVDGETAREIKKIIEEDFSR
jgi:hypothetical protein